MTGHGAPDGELLTERFLQQVQPDAFNRHGMFVSHVGFAAISGLAHWIQLAA